MQISSSQTRKLRALFGLQRLDSIFLGSPPPNFVPQATNAGLQERIAALGTGLIRLANLKPGESKVLLLLNDGIGKSYFCMVVAILET